VHINDVVSALMLLGENSDINGQIEIGGHDIHSLATAAKFFADSAPFDVSIKISPYPFGNLTDQVANVGVLARTGWNQKISLARYLASA